MCIEAKRRSLSCWYCDHSSVSHGMHGLYPHPGIPCSPQCNCQHVPHELIDIYEAVNKKDFPDLYSWLPYNCNNFIPTKIKITCHNKNCKNPIYIEEWRMVKEVYISTEKIITCSQKCNDIFKVNNNV